MNNSDRAIAGSVAPGNLDRGQRCPTCGVPTKHRSDASHRLFFAVIAEAFKQWPHSAEFQPEDAEHLRSYLLVKAKHCDKIDVKCRNHDAISLQMQIAALLREYSDGRPPFIHAYPWGIRAFRPRSIKYSEVDRKQFNAISETVFEILEATLGVKIDDLRREAQKEAA